VPLVEYRCSACGSVFEKLVPRTDGADTADCPVCRAPRGQRVISLFAAVRGGDGESTAGAVSGGCCGSGACGCGSG
jgi:putative FmdB family regulatory protein